MAGYEKTAGKQTSPSPKNPAEGGLGWAGWFFRPALAPILQKRSVLILLAGLAVVQLALTAAGWGAWKCPIYSVLGIPCPGCGLSRAMLLLAQGQWRAAIHMHAFSPVMLAAVIGFAIAGVLPRKQLQNILFSIATVERYTGIVVILTLAVLIYWGLRVTGVIEYMPGF
jgi:hypothetical protein